MSYLSIVVSFIVGWLIAIFCLYQVLASVRCTKRLMKQLRLSGFTVDKQVDKMSNLSIIINSIIILVAIIIMYYFFTELLVSFFVGFVIGFLIVFGKTGLTKNNIRDIMQSYGQFIHEPGEENIQ